MLPTTNSRTTPFNPSGALQIPKLLSAPFPEVFMVSHVIALPSRFPKDQDIRERLSCCHFSCFRLTFPCKPF